MGPPVEFARHGAARSHPRRPFLKRRHRDRGPACNERYLLE